MRAYKFGSYCMIFIFYFLNFKAEMIGARAAAHPHPQPALGSV